MGLDVQQLPGLIEKPLGLGMVAGLVGLLTLPAQLHDLLLVGGRELSGRQGLVDGRHVHRAAAGESRPGSRPEYEWAGLAFLPCGWINMDALWSAALAVSGAVLLAS